MWKIFRRAVTGESAPAIGGQTWFNQDGLPAAARSRATTGQPIRPKEDLAGLVVIVNFWDYSCTSCLPALPYFKTWWEQYRSQGLLIIGVHTPEFEFGREADNVESAVLRFDLRYPIVSDPEYLTWRAYANTSWPADFIIDTAGIVRWDFHGEGKHIEKEQRIKELLAVSRT